MSASPFINKSYVNQKTRPFPLSATLETKKEDFWGRGTGRNNVKIEKREIVVGGKGSKGISVIKEQNEEPEEEFEELEKKHLEFLTAIEKMHFK